jgi:HEAT repeat protein
MWNTLIKTTVACLLLAFSAHAADPIATLKSDAPYLEKTEVCRILSTKGGADAVPALTAMLADEKLSHWARLALEPMPGPEAGAALRGALETTEGRLRVGVIHSLGMRGDQQAVPRIIQLLNGDDAASANAAAGALGMIGGRESGMALSRALAKPEASPAFVKACCDAMFKNAERLTQSGRAEIAIRIYDSIRATNNAPAQVRAAALRGSALARDVNEGVTLLVGAMDGGDADQFAAAMRTAREIGGGDTSSAALAKALPTLSATRKISLMQVLGHRGGIAACPAVLAEAKTGSPEVRVAALAALTRMNYAPALPFAVELAESEDAAVANAARDALSYFPGKEGDAFLGKMLEAKQAGDRRLAIELMGQGALDNPNKRLLRVAKNDTDESVRLAALKALRSGAGMEELSGLLECLMDTRSSDEAAAAEAALMSLCNRQKSTADGNVVIKNAVYGDLPDGQSKDVTLHVTKLVRSGNMSFQVSNRLFGDAAPGIPKSFCVTYTRNGVLMTQTVSENETILLTAATAPSELVDTFCGVFQHARREMKPVALRLVASTGTPKGLEVLRAAAAKESGKVKETALRGICAWSSPDALPTVMELVQTAQDRTIQVLALRGAVRLLPMSGGNNAQLAEQYALLMQQARGAGEKRLVLSGLAEVGHPRALELASAQLKDDEVKAEAKQAVSAINAKLKRSKR